GQYLVWNLAGHVTIRVTNKGAANAVASGVWFDPPGGASVSPPVVPNAPPTVSITAPASGTTLPSPPAITVSANASDTDGPISAVSFLANGSSIGTASTSPYSMTWSPASAGSYTLTAVATDNLGATTTSTGVSLTVTSGGTAASFVRADTTTRGTWHG